MDQYLLVYEVSSYDGCSGIGLVINAQDDNIAKKLAEVAWDKITKKAGFGYERHPEFYRLTSDSAIKIKF